MVYDQLVILLSNMNWVDYIFDTGISFKEKALTVFSHQYQNVPVYRKYVDLLDTPDINSLEDIPFLPIDFYKSHKVVTFMETYRNIAY